MYMVFWLFSGGACRSNPLNTYYEAIETAKLGPKNSFFHISDISDPENYKLLTEGFVS